MERWFDCPCCIAYCHNDCEWCNATLLVGPAPEALRKRLYRSGMWCEEAVAYLDQDEYVFSPVFRSEKEYQRFIQWNATRMTGSVDQLEAALKDENSHPAD